MEGAVLSEQMQRLSGQCYKGDTKDQLFHGEGEYTYSNGMTYKGSFYQGMFHGAATVRFANGCWYETRWHLDRLVSATLHFADGLTYPTVTAGSPSPASSHLSWKYCTDADRRFNSELQHGLVLAPAGQSRLVDGNVQEKMLPFSCYDVGDGYLEPHSGCVHPWGGSGPALRKAEDAELRWAQDKCRIGRDERVQHGDLLL